MVGGLQSFVTGGVIGSVLTVGGGLILWVAFVGINLAIPGAGKALARLVGVIFGRLFGFWAFGMHATAAVLLAFVTTGDDRLSPHKVGIGLGAATALAAYWALRLQRRAQRRADSG